MWGSPASLSCDTPAVGNVAVRSPSNSGLFAFLIISNLYQKAEKHFEEAIKDVKQIAKQ